MGPSGLERHFKYRPYRAKNVLLVDDEGDLGWILRKIVKDAGHKFVYASTLKEGIRRFERSKNLDVAIVDLRLEHESGLTFVKKARTANKKALLIMISAFGTSAVKSKARRLGVRHFLDKPIRVEKLLDIINRDC